jgi:hypothetical protein
MLIADDIGLLVNNVVKGGNQHSSKALRTNVRSGDPRDRKTLHPLAMPARRVSAYN